MLKEMFRQGDVLILRVDEIPTNAKAVKTKTVALGEATGHHHTFADGKLVQVYELEDDLFAQVEGDVQIVHQEHAPITIPTGTWKVVIQREYDPVEVRRVLD